MSDHIAIGVDFTLLDFGNSGDFRNRHPAPSPYVSPISTQGTQESAEGRSSLPLVLICLIASCQLLAAFFQRSFPAHTL
ncbi:MAG TPA: hypothetical protein VF938_07820, partial [Candidatus Angelobacter sp.]